MLMVCLGLNIDSALGTAESDVQLTAFIEDGLIGEQINELLITINNMEHVSHIAFVSKEENWARLKASLDITEKVDEIVTSSPVSACYDVTVDSAQYTDAVVENIRALPGISTLPYAAETVGLLVSLGTIIRIVFLVIIALLALLSIVIITNTIRLTIDNRKIEIGIMKYIGSTNWFIRWPFLLEGLILGLTGALIPVALFVIFYDGVMGFLVETFQFLFASMELISGLDIFPVLAPLTLAIGGVIGTLASVFTMRKYLDV
jgi:cell division transport system permease protein